MVNCSSYCLPESNLIDNCFIILWYLGVYGDVQRVKIMFNKKDNALVQYTDGIQANTGETQRTIPHNLNNPKYLHKEFVENPEKYF